MITTHSPANSLKTTTVILALLLYLATPLQAQTVDRIVAIVNDDVITLSQLQEEGKDYFARIREAAPEDQLDMAMQEARERVLNKLIDQQLISQEAERAGVEVSNQELEDNYARKLSQMGLTRDQFVAKLQKNGISEESFKENLLNQLLRDKLIHYEVRSKIIVTDEMIDKYIAEEYGDKLEKGGYYLRQIGIEWGKSEKVTQSTDLEEADKARARQQAEEIHKELENGADFAELARQKSDLPSAADGGDLGMFSEDELAAYMRNAVLALNVGEITPILETPEAFQIFKLLSRGQGDEQEQVVSEAVRAEIRKKLFESTFNEEFQTWVAELKKGSYVRNMLTK